MLSVDLDAGIVMDSMSDVYGHVSEMSVSEHSYDPCVKVSP